MLEDAPMDHSLTLCVCVWACVFRGAHVHVCLGMHMCMCV